MHDAPVSPEIAGVSFLRADRARSPGDRGRRLATPAPVSPPRSSCKSATPSTTAWLCMAPLPSRTPVPRRPGRPGGGVTRGPAAGTRRFPVCLQSFEDGLSVVEHQGSGGKVQIGERADCRPGPAAVRRPAHCEYVVAVHSPEAQRVFVRRLRPPLFGRRRFDPEIHPDLKPSPRVDRVWRSQCLILGQCAVNRQSSGVVTRVSSSPIGALTSCFNTIHGGQYSTLNNIRSPHTDLSVSAIVFGYCDVRESLKTSGAVCLFENAGRETDHDHVSRRIDPHIGRTGSEGAECFRA